MTSDKEHLNKLEKATYEIIETLEKELKMLAGYPKDSQWHELDKLFKERARNQLDFFKMMLVDIKKAKES